MPDSARMASSPGLALELATETGTYEWWPAEDRLVWSPGLIRIYGLSEPPSAEDGFMRCVHPDDRVRVEGETLSYLSAGNSSYSHRFRIVRPDGTVRLILDRGAIERDEAGRVQVIRGINIDLTEVRAVNARGNRNRLQLASFFASAGNTEDYAGLDELEAVGVSQAIEIETIYGSAPVGLCVIDRDMRFIRINKRLAEINGIPAAAHIGRNFREIVPKVADTAEAMAQRIFETGEPLLDFEVAGETAAHPGSTRVWIANWLPLRDASGEIVAINIVVEDVTERKRSEERVRDRELQLRLALQSSLALAFIWNIPEDRVEQISSGTEAGLAQIARPLTYDEAVEGVHAEDRIAFRAAVEAALHSTDGKYASQHRVVDAQGGVHWLSESGTVEFDAEHRPLRLIGIAHNVTALKQSEEALKSRNRQLDLLARVSQRLLRGGEERQLLSAIFTDVARAIDMEMFFHYRPAGEPRLLKIDAHGGITEEERNLFSTMRFGELLCGRVAEQRARLIVEDLQNSTYPGADVLRAAGATSYAGFPLLAGGELIGTIAFVSRRLTHLADGDLQTIQTICDQLATVLERRRLEQRLAESEESFRLALEGADLGRWDVDLRTGRAIWNKRHFELQGYAAEDVTPSLDHWRTLVHPDDFQRVMEAIDQARSTGALFDEEHRIRRADTGEERWLAVYGRFHFDGEGRPVRFSGVSQDVTDRKLSEQRARLLMREVNHRSKNMLSLVQAVARQTAATDPTDFTKRFGERIQALAASQDLLVKGEWKGVAMDDLVAAQLGHFSDLFDKRILRSGAPITINPATAQVVGMALHELGTNAGKYGALSNSSGTVAITWRVEKRTDGERFVMEWIESGGPAVTAPVRNGFGSTVIGKMAEMSLGADVEIKYLSGGLRWRLACPLAQITGSSQLTEASAQPAEALPARHKPQVLVVEDEALIAIEVAQILEGAGFEVVGPANSVREAFRLMGRHKCDAAVLDINLGADTAEPIALELDRRGTQFVTLSGYSPGQQPSLFRDRSYISKPLKPELLIEQVRGCLPPAVRH